MKKNVERVGILLISSVILSSCATMFAPKTTPVVLINSPTDLVVRENGKILSIERVKAHVKGNADESTTTYYAAGVELDKKVKKHVLELESNGKKNTIEIKLGPSGKWIILDLFTGGIVGWGIDAATKKWREAKNKYIDVPAIIAGTTPMGQGKLKRTMKKQAK